MGPTGTQSMTRAVAVFLNASEARRSLAKIVTYSAIALTVPVPCGIVYDTEILFSESVLFSVITN